MQTAERHNIYTQIHKGLRAFMSEVLVSVGRVDPDDLREVDSALDQVRTLLAFARVHLEHEEYWIHPALEAARSGASAESHGDHEHHLQAFEALLAAVRAVELGAAADRARALLRLYRQLALFVAENFEHMHVEETENHAVLVAGYSEAEVLALNQRLVASIQPADMLTALRWMVPASHAGERTGLLGSMKRNAPAPVCAAVIELVTPYLSARDRLKLDAALAAVTVETSEPSATALAA